MFPRSSKESCKQQSGIPSPLWPWRQSWCHPTVWPQGSQGGAAVTGVGVLFLELRTSQVGSKGMAAWFNVMLPSGIFAGADHQANLDLHGRWFSKFGRLPNAKAVVSWRQSLIPSSCEKKKRNIQKHWAFFSLSVFPLEKHQTKSKSALMSDARTLSIISTHISIPEAGENRKPWSTAPTLQFYAQRKGIINMHSSIEISSPAAA